MKGQPRNTQIRDPRGVVVSLESNNRPFSRRRLRCRNAVAALGVRPQMAKQAVEHLPDFDSLACERKRVGFTDYSQISRGQKMVFELRCRVEGNAQEAAEFSGTLLSGALHDICRDGHCSPDDLMA